MLRAVVHKDFVLGKSETFTLACLYPPIATPG